MTIPLERAFIVSLGALAYVGTRDPEDYVKIMNDGTIPPVVTLVRQYARLGYRPLVLTARMPIAREYTRRWLNEHVMTPPGMVSVIPFSLYTRGFGDRRAAWLVKRDIYRREIQGRFNVALAMEDDPEAAMMWPREGVMSLQIRI